MWPFHASILHGITKHIRNKTKKLICRERIAAENKWNAAHLRGSHNAALSSPSCPFHLEAAATERCTGWMTPRAQIRPSDRHSWWPNAKRCVSWHLWWLSGRRTGSEPTRFSMRPATRPTAAVNGAHGPAHWCRHPRQSNTRQFPGDRTWRHSVVASFSAHPCRTGRFSSPAVAWWTLISRFRLHPVNGTVAAVFRIETTMFAQSCIWWDNERRSVQFR